MMYGRILFATFILILRTLCTPFFIIRNFIMLRKHRSIYKKMNHYGNIKFTEDSPELAEKRSRMVQDSFARSVSRYRDCGAS